MITFTLNSCIRGYHAYRTVNTKAGMQKITVALLERRRYRWPHPSYHFMCVHIILRCGGAIHCTVTGPRKYSYDLLQGGLELPCTYRFTILLTRAVRLVYFLLEVRRTNTHLVTWPFPTGCYQGIKKDFTRYASVHACHWKSCHNFCLLKRTNSNQKGCYF